MKKRKIHITWQALKFIIVLFLWYGSTFNTKMTFKDMGKYINLYLKIIAINSITTFKVKMFIG